MNNILNEIKIIIDKKENINGIQYDFIFHLEKKKDICKCKINVDTKHQVWTISYWFVKKEYQNMGIGKTVLCKALNFLFENYGEPHNIKYIWNGANSYVLDWLETNFDAICECPIAVQKTSIEDDWLSHIYELNVKKVFNYFQIVKK